MTNKLLLGVAVGAAIILSPSLALAAPGPDSITSCVITDGTLTTADYPLDIHSDVAPRVDTVSMVPTPATGKYLYQELGFLNKTTSQFIAIGSGTGSADNAGYQPPADPGYWVATQAFINHPEYPASEYTFEFRWWAVTGTVGSLLPDTGNPLCKISVAVAPADSTPPVISGSGDVSLGSSTTAVATLTADENVAWSLSGGANESLFQIDPTTGALSFLTAPADGTYIVTIMATDDAGNTTTKSITVTVGQQSLASTGSPDPILFLPLGLAAMGSLIVGALLLARHAFALRVR